MGEPTAFGTATTTTRPRRTLRLVLFAVGIVATTAAAAALPILLLT